MGTTWLHETTPEATCAVIAEVGQAHEGSLGFAHAFIDAAARAGADAVKFQTHIAEAESTPLEPWRKPLSSQDRTRFDYWKRMEFSELHWTELKSHAEEVGLLFMSSPFSPEAVELLARVGTAAWKVASGETNNLSLVRAMARRGQPVLISTGMSYFEEIDQAVALVKACGAPLAVLQCTSAYPCPPELVGLNVLSEFRARYDCAVGISEHSGTIFAGLAGATLGIQVLEVHLTLSRDMYGPDVPASVTPEELRTLVQGVRFIETMRRHPVDKDRMPESITGLRRLFTKSVVAARDLEAGLILCEGHLAVRKPGAGIPANDLPSLLGRVVARDIKKNTVLSHDDLEPSIP